MIQIVVLVAGFVPLVYGSVLLVDGSSSLAKRFNIPSIVVGLTIVAFGTSSPELFVNTVAAIQNRSEIVFGNIVGSNIFNVLVIGGIAAIIVPLSVKTSTTWIEVPLSVLSAILVFVVANDRLIDGRADSVISRVDGIVMILFFLVFISYNAHLLRTGTTDESIEIKDRNTSVCIGMIGIGLVLLVVGGQIIVRSASVLAAAFGVPERIIALTVVAMGTSLPELATSVTAAIKRNVDIAIGNIVGSNIFNAFFIFGTSAIIRPVTVPSGANIDLLMNVIASLALFVFIFTGRGRKIERWEGVVFVSAFLGYTAYLFTS